MDLTTTSHFGEVVVDLDSTVYSGFIFLSDGEPATPSQDYQAWVLAFRDTNDANTNEIPDLTDPEQTSIPTAPILSLSLDASHLKLSIAGTTGATYDLEQSLTLSAASWEKTRSVTLTNSTQIVDVGAALNATMFYRLRARP
jgi:hypothetical protein